MMVASVFANNIITRPATLSLVLLSSILITVSDAFVPSPQRGHHVISQSWKSKSNNHHLCMASLFDSQDQALLQERLTDLRRTLYEVELQRPPNPSLSPQAFVTQLLLALYNNDDPLPESGFRLLLRSSTPGWRRQLFHSVGAPVQATEESVASALGQAMGRPLNQFAILVGESNDSHEQQQQYRITFPVDPLDYADGTCWVECRLRDPDDDRLLVVLGWQLQQRSSDGAWLVDRIDWQDFRDQFRPGIGREEWMRICG